MPDTIEVTGIDELLVKLRALPPKVQGKVVRPALRQGTKTVADMAKQIVPVEADGHQLPGGKHLRDTIKVRAVPGRKRGEIALRVVTGTREELGIPPLEKGYYPFALEYGSLAWQPIPFMGPAYRKTRGPVTNTIRAKILAGIEREASK
jgi:HK97 gp10 family phage protein